MKNRLSTFATAIAISTLVACGGSDENTLPTNDSGEGLIDDGSFSGDVPVNDNPANDNPVNADQNTPTPTLTNDLTIGSLEVPVSLTDTGTAAYRFSISDGSGMSYSTESLSVALELSADGDFSNAYRTALFDVRTEGDSGEVYTARSAPVDLPAGAYVARLVVNPDWQYHFNLLPADHNHGKEFRYINESEADNNASGEFQVQIKSTTSCTEDGFEPNNTFQGALPLPVGGQIVSALCLDNVDIFSVELRSNEATSIFFDYQDVEGDNNQSTRLIVLDNNLQAYAAPRVVRNRSEIIVEAGAEGVYYLALYGQRAGYRLTRSVGSDIGIANDFVDSNIFTGATTNGPQSWLLGDIILQKLNFTKEKLAGRVVNCGRMVTQFSNDEPVAYITPQHFADIHEFRFLEDGTYRLDSEVAGTWTVDNGDISHTDWYANDYPGYAQRISGNEWRYWSNDGLAYVECTIEM